jgi:hypothetical protein
MTQPEACRHPGKPEFRFKWVPFGIIYRAWCPACGLETGGESRDALAVFEEWMVDPNQKAGG